MSHPPRLPLFALALASCAVTTSYSYRPDGAIRTTDGYPEAEISVPAPDGSRLGSIHLSSFGLVELTPAGQQPVEVLHVRIAVDNARDTGAWTLAPTDQLADIAGEGTSRPIYVNSDLGSLPAIAIAPREHRILDFYYALPAGRDSEEMLPEFALRWTIATPAGPIARTTRFQRILYEPVEPAPQVIYYTGWAPYWWYDPFYPDHPFHHHRPIHFRPGPVHVTRPPIGHYTPHRGR